MAAMAAVETETMNEQIQSRLDPVLPACRHLE
jgi:hypothetical protein